VANSYANLTVALDESVLPVRIDSLADVSHLFQTDCSTSAVCHRSPWLRMRLDSITRAENLSGVAYLGARAALVRTKDIETAIRDLTLLLHRLAEVPVQILFREEQDSPSLTPVTQADICMQVRNALNQPVMLLGPPDSDDSADILYLVGFLKAQLAVLEIAKARGLCVAYAWT
jgi:hypothetical protein